MELSKVQNRLLLIIVIFLISIVLKELSFIFIPLIVSIFITALLVPVFNFFKKKGLPFILPASVVFVGIVLASMLINTVLLLTANEFSRKEEHILSLAKAKLHPMIEQLDQFTGVNLFDIKWGAIWDSKNDEIVNSVSPIFESLNSMAGTYILIILFLFFLLSGVYSYENFFKKLGSKEEPDKYLDLFNVWVKDLQTYIVVKTWVSAITGVLFGGICYLFGLDFALFFGFIAFLLNYIPQIGSLIATILPLVFGFVVLDNYIALTFLAALLLGTQFIMGNIVEVKFLGKSFAISPVIIFVNLLFWGYIWGIAGLLLSAPILIFIKDFTNSFYKESNIAKLLS